MNVFRSHIFIFLAVSFCLGICGTELLAQNYGYHRVRPQLPNQIYPTYQPFRPNYRHGYGTVPRRVNAVPTVPGFAERDNRPQPPALTISAVVESDNKDYESTKESGYNLYPRMIAEFEPQRAIAISVSDLRPHHRNVFKQVVAKSNGHTAVSYTHLTLPTKA